MVPTGLVVAFAQVDSLSIAVFEAAVESSLALQDWALFLSHVCGLLHTQYPELPSAAGRADEFTGLLLLFFACCGSARDPAEAASEIVRANSLRLRERCSFRPETLKPPLSCASRAGSCEG